jgi:TolB protein
VKKSVSLAVAVLLIALVALACGRGGEELIAFVSNRDGGWEIYVMNPDGSGVVRLTDNAAQDSDAALSPDGRKLAFYSDRSGNREIYVMNSDGSGVVQLTDNTVEETVASWSPDGEKIAFYSNSDGDWEV